MFVLALAGVLHLNSVWVNHIAPEIRTHVSAAVFSVIASAVNKAFCCKALLWATVGGGLALWQVSGAVRAVMGAFDHIYGATSERPFIRRYLISFALAIATGACFVVAAVCLVLAPFFAVRHPGVAWDVLAFLARWALGLGFLSLSVGLLLHVAPATSQPLPWVSLGTMIVIVWWVIVSIGFHFYLTGLASYKSVFRSLGRGLADRGERLLHHPSARSRVGCLCPREQPQGAQLVAGQRQRIDVILDLMKRRASVDHRVYRVMLIGQHPGFLSRGRHEQAQKGCLAARGRRSNSREPARGT